MENINDFAKWTRSNWFALEEKIDNLTPLDERDLNIMSLGLAEETGEVMAILKRRIRDGKFDELSLKKELGDVVHYWAMLCNYFGIEPSEIIALNIEKINDRRARGTLRGTGNDR